MRATGLTIAGFDPSSGAGVTADLLTMAAHGVFGTACITALTVQSTVGVRSVHSVAPEVITATLDCLEDDLPADGIKIGMLGTAAAVDAVAGFLERRRPAGPVVLDPVLLSSSGRALLDAPGLDCLRARLLPLVDWVTPNLAELAVLAGAPVRGNDEVEMAVRSGWRGPRLGVIVTGGHLDEPEDYVVGPGAPSGVWLPGQRAPGRSTHGTGCAFSTALLCGFMAGQDAVEATRAAKRFVEEGIRRAEPRGMGHGPMDLLWPMRG